jgi:Fur family zinc uptake transcriptional regulator
MSFVETSTEILRKKDYKITGPRVAVLSALEKAEIPLSAYDIEERIPKGIPVNVVTVYRVLEIFEKLGIVHRVHTREGYVRCDFEGREGCHYFAVCDKCGRASEFVIGKCTIGKIIPRNLPFKNLKHLSEIAGICDCCSLSTKS